MQSSLKKALLLISNPRDFHYIHSMKCRIILGLSAILFLQDVIIENIFPGLTGGSSVTKQAGQCLDNIKAAQTGRQSGRTGQICLALLGSIR